MIGICSPSWPLTLPAKNPSPQKSHGVQEEKRLHFAGVEGVLVARNRALEKKGVLLGEGQKSSPRNQFDSQG